MEAVRQFSTAISTDVFGHRLTEHCLADLSLKSEVSSCRDSTQGNCTNYEVALLHELDPIEFARTLIQSGEKSGDSTLSMLS